MRPRAFLFAALMSCWNPVHSDAVDALGPERRGVPPGPNHRPGQPCRTCHAQAGPASPEFSVAGTVYGARGDLEPAAGVAVDVVDANDSRRTATTNEVGNFYIATESWRPVFPITVSLRDVRAEKDGVKRMQTSIEREGSCAYCHYGADEAPGHMPAVFIRQHPQ